MLNNAALKQMAIEKGADLVGIASINRFKALPPNANPSFIQTNAKSVIVLGFQIPRGALRGIEEDTAWNTMAGDHPGGYTLYTVEVTYNVSKMLEDDGWEAVPLWRHNYEMRNQGVRVHPDKPEPDVIVDMDFAAHAAGLGHMGKNKLFLTPEFGPRQVFTAILTDTEFEPDKISKQEVCDGCDECVRACPAKALDANKFTETRLCEGTTRWHSLHIESCQKCKTGVLDSCYSIGGEPMRIGAACSRACVAYLDFHDKLTRKFKSRFRPNPAAEKKTC